MKSTDDDSKHDNLRHYAQAIGIGTVSSIAVLLLFELAWYVTHHFKWFTFD